jgi:hypothetical protein
MTASWLVDPGRPFDPAHQNLVRRFAALTQEARWSAIAIAASLVVFGGLVVIAGPFYPTFDEQKYLGIAANLWTGHGLTTVFGAVFTSHAPLWTIVLGAPHALIHGDNLAWGRALGLVSGLGVVAAGGWLAWRVRPAAGAVAAIGLVGMLYIHDQSRTARLDVPAAALGLAYVIVGFEAVRRGSTSWAIAAGGLFAVGFLVKEVDLPFAPVPLLVGVLDGRPWPRLLRVNGWMLLIAAIGVSWWFVLFASIVHQVYRLGTPAWTLAPIGVGLTIVALVAVSAEHLAETSVGARISTAAGRIPLPLRARSRPLIAWSGAILWSVVLSFVLLRTARLSGTGGLSPAQLALYGETWFGPLAIVIVGAVGAAVLAIVAALVDPARVARSGVWELLLATICGLPLVLVVIAVGEPPRNYLAQVAILAGLAAVGFAWLGERVLQIRSAAISVPLGVIAGVAAGALARQVVSVATHGARELALVPVLIAGGAIGAAVGSIPAVAARAERTTPARAARIRRATAAGVIGVGLLGSSAVLGVHALGGRPDSTDPAREAAVRTTVAWLRANVDPTETIAFGSFLGYDMALGVQGRNTTVQVTDRLTVGSPTAPEGLVHTGDAPASDWIAVDIAPRNVAQFQAYRAAWLERQLPADHVGIWVYSIGIDTAAPTILAALTPDHGFDLLKHWSFPVGGSPPLETYVFRVHDDQIRFDPGTIYVSPAALHRLADLLAAHPAAGRVAAANLAGRVVVTPPDPGANVDLDRLRALAGPG